MTSHAVVRISFDDCSQLVVVNLQWCATMLLIFKAILFLARLLEPTLDGTFVSSSWAKCTVDDANCLHYIMINFELK